MLSGCLAVWLAGWISSWLCWPTDFLEEREERHPHINTTCVVLTTSISYIGAFSVDKLFFSSSDHAIKYVMKEIFSSLHFCLSGILQKIH